MEIYDLLEQADPHRMCEYCPLMEDCVVRADSGGYTWSDEWGGCPPEYSWEKLERELISHGVATPDYPASEALYVSLLHYEQTHGEKLRIKESAVLF